MSLENDRNYLEKIAGNVPQVETTPVEPPVVAEVDDGPLAHIPDPGNQPITYEQPQPITAAGEKLTPEMLEALKAYLGPLLDERDERLMGSFAELNAQCLKANLPDILELSVAKFEVVQAEKAKATKQAAIARHQQNEQDYELNATPVPTMHTTNAPYRQAAPMSPAAVWVLGLMMVSAIGGLVGIGITALRQSPTKAAERTVEMHIQNSQQQQDLVRDLAEKASKSGCKVLCF